MIYTLAALFDPGVHTTDAAGRWVLSIPLRYDVRRVQAAWAVLRGRAVALRYPVSGELEQVIGFAIRRGSDDHKHPDTVGETSR